MTNACGSDLWLFFCSDLYDCWAFFAIKLTLLTFPVLLLLLFSFLRTIPSVLPGSGCRWMRMVILFSRICFSPLWFKEKMIIHKAPVHSQNYMKSPKHSLAHSKSSAWLLKWGPRISWQKEKNVSLTYPSILVVGVMQTFPSWEWTVLCALKRTVNVWFVTTLAVKGLQPTKISTKSYDMSHQQLPDHQQAARRHSSVTFYIYKGLWFFFLIWWLQTIF